MAERRDEAFAAGGAAAGAAAMPVRQKNNAKKNPFKDLPEGVHRVSTTDVNQIARKTGKRLENKRYTAKMAQDIKAGKGKGWADKPIEVLVRNDGSARQSSGAHRHWANVMAGKKDATIEVKRTYGPRPTESLYRRAAKDIGQSLQQKRLKQGVWSDKKIDSTAAKYSSRAKKVNTKIAARSDSRSTGGPVDPQKEIGPAKNTLRGKQAGFIAAGAVGGVAAGELLRRDKVGKARNMSEDEIARRKKAQGAIARTTSTLGLAGVGALGVAAAMKKPGTAAKLQRVPGIRGKDPKQVEDTATKIGIVSGGIGGLGGYNFASYTAAEGKRKNHYGPHAVHKSFDYPGDFSDTGTRADYESHLAVIEEELISKQVTHEEKKGAVLGGVGGFFSSPGAAIGGAIAAPKGDKLEGAAAGAVGGLAGPIGGAAGGWYAGRLHRKKNKDGKKEDAKKAAAAASVAKSAFGVEH